MDTLDEILKYIDDNLKPGDLGRACKDVGLSSQTYRNARAPLKKGRARKKIGPKKLEDLTPGELKIISAVVIAIKDRLKFEENRAQRVRENIESYVNQ